MTQTNNNPRARQDAGVENNLIDSSSVQQAIPVDRIVGFLDLLNWSALRLLQEALLDGDVRYWERRAKDFEWARPRPGEWLGQSTEAERAERDQRLAETAQACRAKAEFVRRYGDPELLGAASAVIAGLMDDGREAAA
ncbi:hypothetical protein [Acidipropionibacterium jensenii]|uniref:hypothetical protein n=1 Tax=Acidipropionibacterium jensenii TaxID=1749 RepID=UPI0026484C70|nr:hypothetical protein [Acidipropionibacterium jensenii]MDN6556523.1 hypothetical protein [Acidipropionibacterium acidipropionici]MDN5978109.1 hypothetical protein [Acidipropionibacterium jensenii]MDN5997089.1 hypothetical protein [Acidipropionibacterium jensenii]MDN6020860.1 hypothetical protein [Acidipropionibacterium jensenii]MDN6427470.1 hypothetical protein [Acidipropionibacterium jensenii]